MLKAGMWHLRCHNLSCTFTAARKIEFTWMILTSSNLSGSIKVLFYSVDQQIVFCH